MAGASAQVALQWRLREAFFSDNNSDEFTSLLHTERGDGTLDLNYVYGEPEFEPLLLTACRRHDLARVRRLRDLGADLDSRNLIGDRTALLFAAEQADLPLLQLLLSADEAADAAADETSFISVSARRRPDVNARDELDRTAALVLVEVAGTQPQQAAAALQCLRLLCSEEDVDVNVTDVQGRSALCRAVQLGVGQAVEVLAECGAEMSVGIRQQMEAAPAMRQLVAAFQQRGKSRPRQPAETLWEAVHQGDPDTAHARLNAALRALPDDAAVRHASLNRVFRLHTCLQWAAQSGRGDLATALLDAGASPTAHNAHNGCPPLLYAAERGDDQLLTLLLERMRPPPASAQLELTACRDTGARGMDETALHKVARCGAGSGAAPNPDAEYEKCTQLLLRERIDVNYQNISGETALHLSLRAGATDVSLQLLAGGASLAAESARGQMPVDLVRPSTLQAALDQSVSPVRKSGGPQQLLASDCLMQLDLRCWAPPGRAQKSAEMPVLMRLRGNPLLRPLLRHPAIAALLYLKYDRVRHWYCAHVLITLLFTVFMTVVVFGLDGRAGLPAWCSGSGIRAVLTVGLTLLAAKEAVQMALTGVTYFLSLENVAELAVCAMGFPLLWSQLMAATTAHLSAWLMVFLWLEMAMTMGRLPSLAQYKTMMESIAQSFGRLIFLYFGLVFAFAIAFYLVYSDVDSFATFAVSVPKAIAMATGEFDYGDLSEKLQVDAARGITIGHIISAVLLFICFLFLIFIVLMNLLTALAVDDTKSIMDNAEVMAQDNRILLLSFLENFLMVSFVPRRLTSSKKSSLVSPSATDHTESSCAGIKQFFRSRVLLFHSVLPKCIYEFQPNTSDAEFTCRALAHACHQRRCGNFCFTQLPIDGCGCGRPDSLCELPAEMRQSLLSLVIKEPTLEEQVRKLETDLTTVAAALFRYMEAQNLKKPVSRQ